MREPRDGVGILRRERVEAGRPVQHAGPDAAAGAGPAAAHVTQVGDRRDGERLVGGGGRRSLPGWRTGRTHGLALDGTRGARGRSGPFGPSRPTWDRVPPRARLRLLNRDHHPAPEDPTCAACSSDSASSPSASWPPPAPRPAARHRRHARRHRLDPQDATTSAASRPRYPPGMVVDAKFAGGKVSGFAGCNLYTASATISGAKLTIGPAATTMKACDAGRQRGRDGLSREPRPGRDVHRDRRRPHDLRRATASSCSSTAPQPPTRSRASGT